MPREGIKPLLPIKHWIADPTHYPIGRFTVGRLTLHSLALFNSMWILHVYLMLFVMFKAICVDVIISLFEINKVFDSDSDSTPMFTCQKGKRKAQISQIERQSKYLFTFWLC